MKWGERKRNDESGKDSIESSSDSRLQGKFQRQLRVGETALSPIESAEGLHIIITDEFLQHRCGDHFFLTLSKVTLLYPGLEEDQIVHIQTENKEATAGRASEIGNMEEPLAKATE